MKTLLIDHIIDMEWEMFTHVNGNKITAICQTRPEKFGQMRTAQFLAWPEDALISYTADLENAAAESRNLLREKYIYMMKNTASEEQWKQIERELPECSIQKVELVEKINRKNIADAERFRREYPYLSDRTRPLYSSEDSRQITSIETYERGELMAYSEETLVILWDYIQKQAEAGISFSEEIQRNTFSTYGFQSLKEANEYIKCKQQNE